VSPKTSLENNEKSDEEFLDTEGQRGRDVTSSERLMQQLAGSESKGCQCEIEASGVLRGEAPILHFSRHDIYCLGGQGVRDTLESVKADSHIACRAHAVPLLCRALIHTCHAAPLPFSNSAVSFVKLRVVAGNIRTASPRV